MFSQAHYPSEPLSPEALDLYLSKGWFRTGQRIFTCAYLGLDEEVYRAHWLRIILDRFSEDKISKKLLKCGSKFTIKIEPASITPEKEALYQSYKRGITFDPSESLEHLLFQGSELNIYNTFEVDIYDGDKLIALGYFDTGKESAAGISCFFDPAYKKYSLGKFLIYQKMLYCKNQGINYFYLGYFAPGCKAFDYKLDIAKDNLEYFDLTSQHWSGINNWKPETGSIEETRQKLYTLQQQLNKANIENRLFAYKYFQANLIFDFQGYKLFDYYLFLYCFPIHPDVINPIIVYDFREGKYQLLQCIGVARSEELQDNPEDFSMHLLKTEKILYSTDKAEELTELFVRVLE